MTLVVPQCTARPAFAGGCRCGCGTWPFIFCIYLIEGVGCPGHSPRSSKLVSSRAEFRALAPTSRALGRELCSRPLGLDGARPAAPVDPPPGARAAAGVWSNRCVCCRPGGARVGSSCLWAWCGVSGALGFSICAVAPGNNERQRCL